VTHEMNFAREVADRVLFFADKGIYEQGTPSEIFDAPKREKTIAFIRKLKYFGYEVTDRNFDLLEMQGGIRNFAEKYGLGSRLAYRLELCSDEMIHEMIAGCYGSNDPVKINLDISYSEADGSTVINLTSGGRKFNPFNVDDDDVHLGVSMLKNTAKKIAHNFEDGLNRIEIKL